MDKFFVLAIMFLATTSYGQNAIKDSTLRVVYTNTLNDNQKPAFFINGNFIVNPFLDPKAIDSINVVKSEIQIDGIKYNGQIYITTKSAYSPKLISLTALKDKYTNLKNKPAAFMIDGNIINADYDKYVIDENYLLQLIVDNIENTKQNIHLAIIRLLTRSEENIRRSKEIRIRGGDVAISQ